MTRDTPHDAVTRVAAPRLAALPPDVAARLLSWLVDIAAALPPDDRGVWLDVIRCGDLEPALLAWTLGRDPATARERAVAAWRCELVRQQLPPVPLPAVPLPTLD